MTKRMLIDDTQPEETRVVIVDGNKVEDVEIESSSRKQIKGNIYTAKVIRVEPSLQAAFIDYGGNKHGFLAFGEIHPDYYHAAPELIETVDREVDEIIERKKQYLKEREEQRERIRAEKQALYEARKREEEAQKAAAEETAQNPENAPAADLLVCGCGVRIAYLFRQPLPFDGSRHFPDGRPDVGIPCAGKAASRVDPFHGRDHHVGRRSLASGERGGDRHCEGFPSETELPLCAGQGRGSGGNIQYPCHPGGRLV